jgi:basic membrane protein A
MGPQKSSKLIKRQNQPRFTEFRKTANILLVFIVIPLGVLLAGCYQTILQDPSHKVGYIISGVFGDQGIYDAGKMGIESISKKYGVGTLTLESEYNGGKFLTALQAAVETTDVIFVFSYGFEDQLKIIADNHPNKIIINLDTLVKNSKGTITSVIFRTDEEAYLAGILAGLTTTMTTIPNINSDKVVGFIGGDKDDQTTALLFAYQSGVHSIDPSIEIIKKSLDGDWGNTSKAREMALNLYDQGVDIIFQNTGEAGKGVLQASKGRKLYTLGAIMNQNDSQPEYEIASISKGVSETILKVYQKIVNDSYQPGEILEYGIRDGDVDLVFNTKENYLPQPIIDGVNSIRIKIKQGELKVEQYSDQNVW